MVYWYANMHLALGSQCIYALTGRIIFIYNDGGGGGVVPFKSISLIKNALQHVPDIYGASNVIIVIANLYLVFFFVSKLAKLE